MKSHFVCRSTPECENAISPTKICPKCNKPCQEELDSGEIITRAEIPEYILKDLKSIEAENTKLMNEWMLNTEKAFMIQKGLTVNLDRRISLQTKMKNHISFGLKKLKLNKDKDTKWGYDPSQRNFVGIYNPVVKVVKDE